MINNSLVDGVKTEIKPCKICGGAKEIFVDKTSRESCERFIHVISANVWDSTFWWKYARQGMREGRVNCPACNQQGHTENWQ